MLIRACDACGDGTRLGIADGRRPLNDVWLIRCDACDGAGEVVRYCEGWLCRRPATVNRGVLNGASNSYCDGCAVEMRAEAEAEGGFW